MQAYNRQSMPISTEELGRKDGKASHAGENTREKGCMSQDLQEPFLSQLKKKGKKRNLDSPSKAYS